ncbi:hypothetical protein M569_06867, partial [Genlisea aurea]
SSEYSESAASSSDSSSVTVSFASSEENSSRRCRGLDLLVRAIYQVTTGSVIGVPYIQRRVKT